MRALSEVCVQRLLDLADVQGVLGVLCIVHVDLDDVDLGLGQLEPHVFGGLELPVAEDDLPQLVQVLEAHDGAALDHIHLGVDDRLELDAQVAVDELLGVADAHARPGLVVDVLHQVVELQRAVLGRRR
jgi:hypothetical protein